MAELSLQDMLRRLPPELQTEALDFIEFLLERKSTRQRRPMKFQWEGALKDLRGQYTSVQLQHQVADWRGDTMKALLDTNIFLEILLSQEKSGDAKSLLLKSSQHEFFLTDYSLHSIGVLLFRKKQHEAFRTFVEEVLLNGGIGILSLRSGEMDSVILSSQKFGLDFDDAYQYATAERYDLILVSFDSDFQRTDREHKAPAEILQVIS